MIHAFAVVAGYWCILYTVDRIFRTYRSIARSKLDIYCTKSIQVAQYRLLMYDFTQQS